nr:MAG TPA: hypothetical protein [Caudoviricetes sp.]
MLKEDKTMERRLLLNIILIMVMSVKTWKLRRFI